MTELTANEIDIYINYELNHRKFINRRKDILLYYYNKLSNIQQLKLILSIYYGQQRYYKKNKNKINLLSGEQVSLKTLNKQKDLLMSYYTFYRKLNNTDISNNDISDSSISNASIRDSSISDSSNIIKDTFLLFYDTLLKDNQKSNLILYLYNLNNASNEFKTN